jgi:uncharacterized membrane protein
MLASDADRDRAAEVLKSGFASGRLTKDEHDDHLHLIYTARTNGELVQATSQLPGGGMALFAAPVPPRTNPLAVAALACGVAGFFTGGLTSIPAIVMANVARGQMRRTGEQGRGLALTGLILGWLAVLTIVLVVTVATVVAVHLGHTVFFENGGEPAVPRPG